MLCLNITSPTGDNWRIQVDPTSTVSSILDSIGIKIPENTTTYFVYNGMILSQYLSLNYQNVTNNASIFFLNKTKKISFRHLSISEKITQIHLNGAHNDNESELRRLSDFAFLHLESSRKCNQKFIAQYEAVSDGKTQQRNSSEINWHTEKNHSNDQPRISNICEISDEPLPICFKETYYS